MTITTFNIQVGGASVPYMSYATIAEADQELRLKAQLWSTWSALDATDKQVHLASATKELDKCEFIGIKTDASQELEWPRVQERADPNATPPVPADVALNVNGDDLPTDQPPEAIVQATAILAAITHQVATNQTGDRDRSIKKLVGDREEIEYFEPHLLEAESEGMPGEVTSVIVPYLAVAETEDDGDGAVCSYDRDFFPGYENRPLTNEEKWSW